MNPLTREWVEKAEEDFAVAQREAARGNPPPFNAICFHAQQCAEKYLKARLCEAGKAITRTHDLPTLLNDLIPARPGPAVTGSCRPCARRFRRQIPLSRCLGCPSRGARCTQPCDAYPRDAASHVGPGDAAAAAQTHRGTTENRGDAAHTSGSSHQAEFGAGAPSEQRHTHAAGAWRGSAGAEVNPRLPRARAPANKQGLARRAACRCTRVVRRSEASTRLGIHELRGSREYLRHWPAVGRRGQGQGRRPPAGRL